jgi:hypothetical protein
MINLAHAGIQRRNDPAASGFLRQRFQSAYARHRQIGRESQPLGDPAGDAQTGEGSGTGPKGNTVQLRQRYS